MVVFQENAVMEHTAALPHRWHVQVEEPGIINADLDEVIEAFLLPVHHTHVVGTESVVIVLVGVVPIDE